MATPRAVHEALVRTFQITAIAEAITWIGLLVGMLFKYVVASNPAGVRFFGPVHGFVFCGYLIAVLLVRPELRWNRRMTVIAIAASVPPLATWPFERWALRLAREIPEGERGLPPRAPRPSPLDP
jgi:integral membrane protein